jgi:hypothetical protein
MPETSGDFAWWAFNFVTLVLMALAKSDLTEIKRDGKKNRELNEANARDLAAQKAACTEKHIHIENELRRLSKTP